jgi:copper(I)-binding protein
MPSRSALRSSSRSAPRAVSRFVAALGLGFGLTLAALAVGHEYKAGDIVVGHPYARATVPGQPSAGAYLSIENKGREKDTLTAVHAAIAKSTELHAMTMDGNVMKMREVGAIDIKPSETISMQPGGGFHLMLIGIAKPLRPGDTFPMTLTFAKAGKIDVSVYVEDPAKAGASGAGHKH